jgi:hypothetical protein
MTIKNILFLNGWEGRGAIRVKAEIIDDDGKPRDVVIEKDEAARILTTALNAGARLTLTAGQKLYRVEATGGRRKVESGDHCVTCGRDDVGLTETDGGELVCDNCWK